MARPLVAATPLRRDIVSFSHLTVRGVKVGFGSVPRCRARTYDYSRIARFSWWMRDDELDDGFAMRYVHLVGVVLFLFLRLWLFKSIMCVPVTRAHHVGACSGSV
jgi:hypothetical protein